MQGRSESIAKPLLAAAHGDDKIASKMALAKLDALGHHPVSLAVYDRPKLFRAPEFKHSDRVMTDVMHSWKEVDT